MDWIVCIRIGLCWVVELWNLKSTLVWSVTFAFVTMLNVNRITEENTFFRKTARDTV